MIKMNRKDFLTKTMVAGLGMNFIKYKKTPKTHILTFSFDDGFKKSFYKVADIFEKHDLKACLNVLASAHLPGFKAPDKYMDVEIGNFNDWNSLQKRGHEIMPHSWAHENLARMSLLEAKENIEKCLAYFEKNLDGFRSKNAVFNMPYNASTPEVEDFLLTRVKAIRTNVKDLKGANPFPSEGKPVKLGCRGFGPDNGDKWIENEINRFLSGEGGWLILNQHGLDDEGWGPVSSVFLDSLLGKLTGIDHLDILPASMALKKYS